MRKNNTQILFLKACTHTVCGEVTVQNSTVDISSTADVSECLCILNTCSTGDEWG